MGITSWQRYLEEQLPKLRQLHTALDSGPSEIEQDQQRLDDAIRNAVDGVIKLREVEVESWRKKIVQEQDEIRALCDALCASEQDRNLASSVIETDVSRWGKLASLTSFQR
jgi:uncharacterized protein YdcH (DUF465 family)